MTISCLILLRMRYVANKVAEKTKYTFYIHSENHAVNEKMKNMVVQDRLQITILWHAAHWISKATHVQTHTCTRAPTPIHISKRTCIRAHTHIHTEMCNTYCYSMETMVSWTHLNVTLYKVVQIWPGKTVTCLHTNRPGHIWTTLYINSLSCWLCYWVNYVSLCSYVTTQKNKMCFG
jgi:hypothetical protein